MNYDQDHKYTNSHTHINGMAIKLWYQVSSILIDSQYLDFLIKYNLAPQISMDIYIFIENLGLKNVLKYKKNDLSKIAIYPRT